MALSNKIRTHFCGFITVYDGKKLNRCETKNRCCVAHRMLTCNRRSEIEYHLDKLIWQTRAECRIRWTVSGRVDSRVVNKLTVLNGRSDGNDKNNIFNTDFSVYQTSRCSWNSSGNSHKRTRPLSSWERPWTECLKITIFYQAHGSR